MAYGYIASEYGFVQNMPYGYLHEFIRTSMAGKIRRFKGGYMVFWIKLSNSLPIRGEIVPTNDVSTTNANALRRPVPARPWMQPNTYGITYGGLMVEWELIYIGTPHIEDVYVGLYGGGGMACMVVEACITIFMEVLWVVCMLFVWVDRAALMLLAERKENQNDRMKYATDHATVGAQREFVQGYPAQQLKSFTTTSFFSLL
ncbi:hypothetical protein L2E82_41768 [Cichorium intybus]|uniref:Uncharacterized protein n=1 Tax=Cichorium intybus TaxID=13427 RepID=A0ACB8ZLD7_CICIN|nr:hypothetical protein L2E82_41768 [Cichorium intybus]